MRNAERIVVYAAVGLLALATLCRREGARADAPADATFATLTVSSLKVGGPGGPVVSIGADAAGNGELRISFADGKPAAVLSATAAGGELRIRNAAGKSRCGGRTGRPARACAGGPRTGATSRRKARTTRYQCTSERRRTEGRGSATSTARTARPWRKSARDPTGASPASTTRRGKS